MENNMKKIALLFVVLSMLSCQCKKAATQQTTANVTSECPKDGTCTIEVSPNKSIVVKKDEFGSVFYTLEESTSKKVIKYTYKRTVKGDIQDANYREEIIFELDSETENLELSDAALEKTQLLFGRFCFCRGQTGNYKINQGKLTVTKNSIDLNFKTDQVPQIIKHVAFSIN
jgi:hypothetical protein